ncbi:MAG: PAS domain-containing protein [Myxococcales bacterium]|nr:MAG: PAS domain-containing protein [Myxococcales bacterium]
MDDSAHKKPPARQSSEPRVSAVKSIVTPRRRTAGAPTLPQILESLNRAERETRGFATDEKVLRSNVHALERLYPTTRFAMRLAPRAVGQSTIVQATTHYLRAEATEEVAITEAGLLRGGFPQPAAEPTGMRLRRTYEPILLVGSTDVEAPADGLDAPLSIGGEVIGVLAAELDRGTELPDRLEDALLMTATHASASIETGRLRREALHLRDYLEKLLEHANIPVLVVGRDRAIRVVSSAFVRITGLARDQLDTKDVLQLAGQSDRARVLSAFVNALRGREVPPFELRLPKADGGNARLQFTLAPILDSEGRVAGVIAIGQDRTEVHELEGQVIHAEKLATLGQLAAGIVHEINNPLTSISVYGEYLLSKLTRSGAEESDVKRVERILRSSDRIMSFTRNLLTYARPSKEEAQPLDVNDVLEEAIGFCDHIIREARMTVLRDYGEGLPRITAVPGQLHQVFVNLITNACNAAHDDGGEVRISTRLHGRDRIHVRVEDDGVGIGKEDMSRVFEPFFSTRRRGKGTGLGLSIVKSIVEQHRGGIEIDSEIGGGTSVRIVLPCVDE